MILLGTETTEWRLLHIVLYNIPTIQKYVVKDFFMNEPKVCVLSFTDHYLDKNELMLEE